MCEYIRNYKHLFGYLSMIFFVYFVKTLTSTSEISYINKMLSKLILFRERFAHKHILNVRELNFADLSFLPMC